jgi:hypothetical protein
MRRRRRERRWGERLRGEWKERGREIKLVERMGEKNYIIKKKNTK